LGEQNINKKCAILGLEPDSAEEKAVAESLGQRIEDCYDSLKPLANCLLGLSSASNVFFDLKCNKKN
jgi:hypothetical protein